MSAPLPNIHRAPPTQTLAQKILSILRGKNHSIPPHRSPSTAAGSELVTPNASSTLEMQSSSPAETRIEQDPFEPIDDNTTVTAVTPQSASEVKGKLLSVNFAIFIAGLNDGALGPLIPSIQTTYNIGLLLVAVVYLLNFAGWLVAAFTNVHAMARIGQSGVLVVGACSQLLAYALILWKPPFPLFVIAFFFSGLGVAFQDAQANTFAAGVNNAHWYLGLLHAVYGAGALVAPLVATVIATKTPYWHYYYVLMLGVTAVDVGLLTYTFWKGIFMPVSATAKDTASKELSMALSKRATWVLAMFFFFYVGAEVTTGGWVVEFLISVHGGVPSQVGYVASGFWGGLTIGRIVLAEPVNRLGERLLVMFLIAAALAMQLIYWFVPSVIANAVVVSLLGFFIAPFFPVGISVLTKLLPKELHVASIGFTSTFGQAGSAAFPFLTGAIASKAGVQVLQPIMVGLLGSMFILWALVPKVQRRTE